MSLLMHTDTPSTTSARWAEVHARSRAVHDLAEEVRRRGPLAAQRVRHPFADHADQLRALHELWSRRLACRVDVALELGEADPVRAVTRAWRATGQDLPGVRAALDAGAADPVVQRMDAVDLRTLAVAAGLSTLDAPLTTSAAIGARLTR